MQGVYDYYSNFIDERSPWGIEGYGLVGSTALPAHAPPVLKLARLAAGSSMDRSLIVNGKLVYDPCRI